MIIRVTTSAVALKFMFHDLRFVSREFIVANHDHAYGLLVDGRAVFDAVNHTGLLSTEFILENEIRLRWETRLQADKSSDMNTVFNSH